MGKKYLRVEVTKEVHSDVYLEIDENDPRFLPLLQNPTWEARLEKGLCLPEDIHAKVIKIVKTYDEGEWEAVDFSASYYPIIISEEEAKNYFYTTIDPLTKKEKDELNSSS